MRWISGRVTRRVYVIAFLDCDLLRTEKRGISGAIAGGADGYAADIPFLIQIKEACFSSRSRVSATFKALNSM